MTYLLHHLLSESALNYPNRTAVSCAGRGITYAELERSANRLANALRTLGITKRSRVGIYMSRGIESILAALGTLKAGAAYVPIDPMAPFNRVEYIIKQSRVKVLITHGHHTTSLAQIIHNIPCVTAVFALDGFDSATGLSDPTNLINGPEILQQSRSEPPDINVMDRDIAYILFTSGSTGNPKGVVLSHLNSLTFVNTAAAFFDIRPSDKLSNISPLHFDMSVFDIYVAFKAGACVVIIPETCAMFPAKVAEYLSNSRVTVWNSVPSLLSMLANLQNLEHYDFTALRLILFAGEIFPLKYLRRMREYIPQARYCNMYGQTEANSSTYYWIDDVPSNDTAHLPIGRALPNFEVFALDELGKVIQETGEEGELYVRSSSVALGYCEDAIRTAESFVRNPLDSDLDEKVYKTGDFVRLDCNGNYVFLGRKDNMIKSRGYRIEIGEIEAVLMSHPEIKEAVVVPIADPVIGNRILAVVVPEEGVELGTTEILRYCSKRLPKYMIPESIDFRGVLPRTASGKIDRKGMSAIER